jgi:hypothetical protein
MLFLYRAANAWLMTTRLIVATALNFVRRFCESPALFSGI